MQLKSDDLPAPFGPMIEKSSPSRTENVTPSRALTPAKLRDSPSTTSRSASDAVSDPVSRMGNSSFRRHDTEVEGHDVRVGAQVRGGARLDDPAALEDVAVLGDRQRHGGVLLDEQDRGALTVDVEDDVADRLHDLRSQAET